MASCRHEPDNRRRIVLPVAALLAQVERAVYLRGSTVGSWRLCRAIFLGFSAQISLIREVGVQRAGLGSTGPNQLPKTAFHVIRGAAHAFSALGLYCVSPRRFCAQSYDWINFQHARTSRCDWRQHELERNSVLVYASCLRSPLGVEDVFQRLC